MVSNLDEALQALDRLNPDLIIVDYDDEKLNRDEFLARFVEGAGRLRVVLLSLKEGGSEAIVYDRRTMAASHIDEWLEKVAKNYGTNGNFIRSTNNLEDPVLRARQQVIVYNKKGMVHIARGGEPIDQIIKAYERLGGRKENILAQNAWDEIAHMHNGRLTLKEGAKLWIPSAQKSFPILFRPFSTHA